MTVITESYNQAELALAAYSNLTSGMTDKEYINALVDDGKGMSEAQAIEFASKWSVVTQYNDSITGVSATVFQKVGSGEKYLAIRGTQGPTDYLADYLILNGVPAGMNPQYWSLKAQLQVWLDDPEILKDTTFTVSGHSLGGYLAAALVADFGPSISQVYLYNAPGNSSTISQIMQTLGILNSPDSAKITSLRADAGLSPIAGLGNDFSPPIKITIENQLDPHLLPSAPLALNHSQRVLTDALAVYSLYSEFSPTFSVEDITAIIQTNTYRPDMTLEISVQQIADILISGGQQIACEDREALYATIQSLAGLADPDTFRISTLTNLSDSELTALATTQDTSGLAIRYALVNCVPFYIAGNDTLYDKFNNNGELNLYNSDTKTGNLTLQYVEDRSLLLYYLAHPDAKVSTFESDIDFVDNRLGISLEVDNGMNGADADRQYLFGNLEGELLEGGNESDHLYGMDGDDILNGGTGADYLEGGADNDTYILAGDGQADTVFDIDKTGGVLKVGDQVVSGEFKGVAGNGMYYSENYQFSLKKVDAENWELFQKTSGDYQAVATLKDWQSGQFGITTTDEDPKYIPADYSYALRYYITINMTQAPRGALMIGNVKNDWLLGSDYGDKIITGYDETNSVSNIVIGGYGSDIVTGSGGYDYIMAGNYASDDTFTDDDFVEGGGSSDIIYGGYGSDTLFGGAGGDTIRGGAGDDLLLGDAEYELHYSTFTLPATRGGLPVLLRAGLDLRVV